MSIIRFKAEKLIRDKMPTNLHNKGISAATKELSSHEYLAQLKDKLVEEAQEVFECKDKQELIEELADVLEVVRAISWGHQIALEEVEAVRQQKREKRGGFENKTYCTTFEMDETHPDIGYYLSKPHVYPVIHEGN